MMRQLALPRRTFYRYLDLVFEDRKLIFEEISREEVMRQTCILKQRLADGYVVLRDIASDKSVDPTTRIDAMGKAMDAAMLVTRTHLDAPARVAKFAMSILDDVETIASAVTMGKLTAGKGGGNGKNNNNNNNNNKSAGGVVTVTDTNALPFQTKNTTTTPGEVVSAGIDFDEAHRMQQAHLKQHYQTEEEQQQAGAARKKREEEERRRIF